MGKNDTSADEWEMRRRAIDEWHLADEARAVEALLRAAMPSSALLGSASAMAASWVEAIRTQRAEHPLLQALLREFSLDTDEGVALMCVAEALLRIPDAQTADRLIQDKFLLGHWEEHLGQSGNWFVNASAWALMLTGEWTQARHDPAHWLSSLTRVAARLGDPLIRGAFKRAMRAMGQQFVFSSHIQEALRAIQKSPQSGDRYSFDMLGEAALTGLDAERYYYAYASAIETVAHHVVAGSDLWERPGISIKLSALHPRFDYAQRTRVMQELAPRVLDLAIAAKRAGIPLTLDAEEADRWDLTLDIFTAVYSDAALHGWEGFGLAVQAYQKRARATLDFLELLADRHGRRIAVRLVKGAYWDSEIKRAQERGLIDYPVYTRKTATDVSYLVCAQRLLARPRAFYPQFATHNAHTVAAVLALAQDTLAFEFQRLHGMGEALYRTVRTQRPDLACRVYAPIGRHQELLPYLVRRLLENGANSSFVHRLEDPAIDVADIVADPCARLAKSVPLRAARIPLPAGIYGEKRKNSAGYNLYDAAALQKFLGPIGKASAERWQGGSLVGGKIWSGAERAVTAPADRRRVLGSYVDADLSSALERALSLAYGAFPAWSKTHAGQRATVLRAAADLFELHASDLLARIVHEGGRTLTDAIAELREAVDYCRFYAAWIAEHFAAPVQLPGPAGEDNILFWRGRGVFVCISPWNFPLAIFVGQVSAALAAGNCVIAKPAAATPLVATRAVELLHQAGVPVDALHLLAGEGVVLGARLLSDTRVAGVAFTGSTATARAINAQLAARPGPIVPLIAETGGVNAMIVDSSALPEQVVNDILISAFNSAGQRCSALRIVYLQREIAARVIGLLGGALAERQIGDPADPATDIGPMIDAQAVRQMGEYCQSLTGRAQLLYEAPLPPGCAHGDYFAPRVYLLEKPESLTREVFGPILHIALFRANELDRVVDIVNRNGYGLTFGVHSRIQSRIDELATRIHAGNIYANRSTIGAVVGAQPFGGEGLSGTGPKAGGPHYLYRFATEVVVSQNTTASGGNAALFADPD